MNDCQIVLLGELWIALFRIDRIYSIEILLTWLLQTCMIRIFQVETK